MFSKGFPHSEAAFNADVSSEEVTLEDRQMNPASSFKRCSRGTYDGAAAVGLPEVGHRSTSFSSD
jgi:hypothetical protein